MIAKSNKEQKKNFNCEIKSSSDGDTKYAVLTRNSKKNNSRQNFFEIKVNDQPSNEKIINASSMVDSSDLVFDFVGGEKKKVTSWNQKEQNVTFSQSIIELDNTEPTNGKNPPSTEEDSTKPSPESDDSQSDSNTNLPDTDAVEKPTEHFSETQIEPSPETNDTQLTIEQWIIVGVLVGAVLFLIGCVTWLCNSQRCCRANDRNFYSENDVLIE